MTLKEKLPNGEKLIGIWDGFNLEEMGVEYHVTGTEHWRESESYGGYRCVKF